MNRTLTIVILAAGAVVGLGVAAFLLVSPDRAAVSSGDVAQSGTQTAATDLLIEEFPIVGQSHIRQGEPGGYNSNPPTSGGHFGSPRPWGVFGQPIADESAVHNIEHGGIWITYDPELDAASVRQLRDIAAQYPNAVLMSPRPENDSQISIVSWGRMMNLDEVNTAAIDRYVRTYVNNSPEQFASLEVPPPEETVELEVGAPFPSFNLTEIDGAPVSMETLSGRPAIIWFTTAWCVPCQIGAMEVARLDEELGGDAFDVFVVFVDLSESADALRGWRDEFAAPDWQVGFDDPANSLAARIGLQYLDSKYLVNADGILLNQDFRIADDAYLEIIRTAVEGT